MAGVKSFLRKRPYIRWILILAVVLFALFGFLNQYNRFTELRSGEVESAQTSVKLTGEDYTSVRDHFLIRVNTDLKVALDEFREDIDQFPEIANTCHPISHEMGHKAFSEYGFQSAISIVDDVCNGGYIHGVIESYLASVDDVNNSLRDVCSSIQSPEYLRWQCYHGIGHGVMFSTDNNVTKSVKFCRSLSEINDQSACVNGVFMENFGADGVTHLSEEVDPNDAFYPCYNQKEIDKEECYIYSAAYRLTLSGGDYSGTLAWCNTANEFITRCAYGVGAELMRSDINNLDEVEKKCLEAPTNLQHSCMRGAFYILAMHHGTTADLKLDCGFLTNFTFSCIKVAEELEPFFAQA